jgi:hypothetical protein
MVVSMAKEIRIRGNEGKFEPKGDEPRKTRGLTLTDTAWENLNTTAKQLGVSKSDLVEQSALEGRWNPDYREEMLDEIRGLIEEMLEDQKLTRNGKDRGVVRRTLEKLIDLLGG